MNGFGLNAVSFITKTVTLWYVTSYGWLVLLLVICQDRVRRPTNMLSFLPPSTCFWEESDLTRIYDNLLAYQENELSN